MIAEETIRSEIERRLQEASLLPFVVCDKLLYLDMSDQIFVEVLLSDDSRREEVKGLLEEIAGSPDFKGKPFEIIVRSTWKIEGAGATEIARSPDGGVRAAVIVPVRLRAGSAVTTVNVAVSWLALEELKRISGQEPNLQDLAFAYVESLLKPGGQSYWEPTLHSYLEIGAEMALVLYRMLKKTA
jgi:hypothetical protein